MPDPSLDVIQADLVACGVLLSAPPPRLTPRARAAFMRAAAHLRDEEAAGRPPIGPPLVLAAERALAEVAPGASTQAHARFLAAVELASMPEGLRGYFTSP